MRKIVILLGAVWLGLGGLAGLYFFVAPFFSGRGPEPSSEGAPAIPAKPSIAVLPFTNMSGDPGQEYFSDGITEDIITALSRVKGLFVIARNSTFTYKGRAVKAQRVGRELGVKFLLEGSVRKVGQRLRITAQLIDATTGNHLWPERYDRSIEDVLPSRTKSPGRSLPPWK